MKNIFDKTADTTIKNRSLQEKLMLLLTFVLVPVASVLITLVASDRPVSTSMSRIAWVDKQFFFVALWGLINMGNYIYSMTLVVKKAGYSVGWKKFFIVSASVAALIMTVGLSIPAYYSETDIKLQQMRTAHVVISGAGFFYYVAEVFFVTLTLIKRNKTQFCISLGMALFIAIGGVYSITYVNDPSGYCFCSTVTQLFLFGMSNAFLAVQYFFMDVFPEETSARQMPSKREIIMLVMTFVIVPVVSILITLFRKDRPVFTSMSRIAWVDNHLPLVYLWGLINVLNFIHTLFMTIKTGEYSRGRKRFFLLSAAIAALFLVVGVSIPAHYDPSDKYVMTLRSWHTGISAVGFIYYFAECVIFVATTYKRNERHFLLSLGMVAFLLISGVFSYVFVNDPNSYCFCSSVTQVYLFCAYNAFIAIQYFLVKQFGKNDGAALVEA